MDIIEISPQNRVLINDFICSHWFTGDMIIRGEIVDITKMDGFVIFDGDEIIGLITYRISDGECEITSFDSVRENIGIGTELLKKVIDISIRSGCRKIKLITTNDNINAIKFYQKRGFDMARIYSGAVESARKLKPSIPLIGNFGIPIKHEIEFEMYLDKES